MQHTDIATGGAGRVRTSHPSRRILIQGRLHDRDCEAIPGETGSDLVDRDGNLVTDILYVNIAQFHGETPSELISALAEAESGRYMGLIIDVRGNPGGFLRQTVQATDEFLDEGAILTEIDAEAQPDVWRDPGARTRSRSSSSRTRPAPAAPVLAPPRRQRPPSIVGMRSFARVS